MKLTIRLMVPGQMQRTVLWDPARDPTMLDMIEALLDRCEDAPSPTSRIPPTKSYVSVNPKSAGPAAVSTSDGSEKLGKRRTKSPIKAHIPGANNTRHSKTTIAQAHTAVILIRNGSALHDIANQLDLSLSRIHRIARGETFLFISGFTPAKERKQYRSTLDPRYYNVLSTGQPNAEGQQIMRAYQELRDTAEAAWAKSAAIARAAHKAKRDKQQQ